MKKNNFFLTKYVFLMSHKLNFVTKFDMINTNQYGI